MASRNWGIRLGVLLAGILAAAIPVGGCSSTPETASANSCTIPTTGDLPCDVAAVLQSTCQPCHQSPGKNHAPFPLLTYEDLAKPLGSTGLTHWQRAAQVITPNNFPSMPPSTATMPLSDTDRATLSSWFEACAPPLPEGTGCDADNPIRSMGADASKEDR